MKLSLIICLCISPLIINCHSIPEGFKITEKDIVEPINQNNRNVVRSGRYIWPRGVIPYTFESGRYFTTRTKNRIVSTLRKLEAQTCLQFKLQTNERDYIKFVNDGSGQCWSFVGRQGGEQDLSLGSGCVDDHTVAPEVMHALGFY